MIRTPSPLSSLTPTTYPPIFIVDNCSIKGKSIVFYMFVAFPLTFSQLALLLVPLIMLPFFTFPIVSSKTFSQRIGLGVRSIFLNLAILIFLNLKNILYGYLCWSLCMIHAKWANIIILLIILAIPFHHLAHSISFTEMFYIPFFHPIKVIFIILYLLMNFLESTKYISSRTTPKFL